VHSLSLVGFVLVAIAGLVAGTINAIVGSGSLITFPTLVALGLSPFVANVSNNIGIVFGTASGSIGYRRELTDQGRRILALGPWSAAGGLAGAILLLVKPGAFHDVVPWLILLAVAMVIAQPWLSRKLVNRRSDRHAGGWVLRVGVLLTGVYGGYFGAAQGVILIALLVISIGDTWVRMNALKIVLAAIVNALASIVFIIAAPIEWSVVGVIAVTSAIGGQIGAQIGRRIPDPVLRAVIVVGGVAITIKLLV
jgi:uncharacterized protein